MYWNWKDIPFDPYNQVQTLLNQFLNSYLTSRIIWNFRNNLSRDWIYQM